MKLNEKQIKIINGGMYLVDLGRHRDPELSSPHYCVIIKTHDPQMILCLPTTTKLKDNEKYKKRISEDGSTCLFKQSRFISKKRILKALNNDAGEQIVLSNNSLNELLNEYNNFLFNICKNAIRGNNDYFDSLNKLKINN